MKIFAKDLKVGDRFSEIPPAWHGPSVVRDIYISGVDVCIKFDNKKIINPPGVMYVQAAGYLQVRKLKRTKNSMRLSLIRMSKDLAMANAVKQLSKFDSLNPPILRDM